MPSPPFMPVMKYMVPSVLVLATLKYQNKPESLFRENPAPVVCSVVATCVYWLIVGAAKQMTTIDPKYSRIFSHAALATGVLSALSLLSVFLQYPVSLVPLVIWTSLPVVLAWPDVCNLLLRGIEGAVDRIHGVVVWARGVDSMEEASSPV